MQYLRNHAWLSSASWYPDGCWSDFAWRLSASWYGDRGLWTSAYRSDADWCCLDVVDLLWLWLFYEVGVGLRSLRIGYIGMRDRL